MLLSFKENLSKDLKNKTPKPIYFLCGEENYFIEKTITFIEKSLLKEEEKLFDQFIFEGAEIAFREIILQANRYPTLANFSLIVVKEAQNLAKIEELNFYLKNPNPTTVLVIGYKDKALDKKKEFYKNLKKNDWIFEFKKLYENQIPYFVKEKVFQMGYKISLEACFLFVEYIGNDLFLIENQLKKLVLKLRKDQEISISLIKEQIGIDKRYSTFELQGALSKKNSLEAYKILFYFLKNPKAYPIALILGMLYHFFSKILHFHALMPGNELLIAKEIGVPPFFIKEYKQAYENYSLKKVLVILSEISKADCLSKGINSPFIREDEILKELFFKLFND